MKQDVHLYHMSSNGVLGSIDGFDARKVSGAEVAVSRLVARLLSKTAVIHSGQPEVGTDFLVTLRSGGVRTSDGAVALFAISAASAINQIKNEIRSAELEYDADTIPDTVSVRGVLQDEDHIVYSVTLTTEAGSTIETDIQV